MDQNILKRILRTLEEIEQKENVRILYAVESGSRAWGFASHDSDYDVRFIYVRKAEDYLSLTEKRDVIEWELNDVYDVSGWDLKKTLLLAQKSNPTLFEWIRSPIVYRTSESWQAMVPVMEACFREKSGIYHYYGTALTNYKKYLLSDQVKLKAYFYVLRPLLACRWIADRQTPPPVPFEELVESYLPEEIRPEVEDLVRRKVNTPEIGKAPAIVPLNDYLSRELDAMGELLKSMPEERPHGLEALNRVFLSMLGMGLQ